MPWAAVRLGSSPTIIMVTNIPVLHISTSLLLLGTHATRERTSDCHLTVREPEWQYCQRPRSRSAHDPCSILGIERRSVARTDKVFGLVFPAGNVTAGMGTDSRIADNPL